MVVDRTYLGPRISVSATKFRKDLERIERNFELLEVLFSFNKSYLLLLGIWSGEGRAQLTYTYLRRILNIPKSSLSRNVEKLKKLGLIGTKKTKLKDTKAYGLQKKRKKYEVFYTTKKGKKVANKLMDLFSS